MSSSAAAGKIPQSISELIAQASEHWRHCEGLEEATLLRLAILRDLMRQLHAEKSRSLAQGSKTEAQSLKVWELRIEDLRGSLRLEGELMELLSDPAKKPKTRKRLLPEALFTTLAREKLERYDRQWEASLAAEAAQMGWQFWILDAWIDISSVEDWNQKLNEKLWPHGVVLFADNASDTGGSISTGEGEGAVNFWHGRWFVLMHPRFRAPDELLGSSSHLVPRTPVPPSLPRWKLLFSLRPR
jgi:hypothetical protein